MRNMNKKAIFYTKEGLQILFTAVVYTMLPLVVFTMLTARPDLIPGFNSFTVLTGSMEPLVPVGSVVYVYKSGYYSPGDIISFEAGKINVTHRITGIVRKDGQVFYQTKGDANSSVDSELVNPKNITGEIVFHLPYAGRFIAFLRSVPGFLSFIILPSMVYIGFELWNIKKEIEKVTEQKVLKKVMTNWKSYT